MKTQSRSHTVAADHSAQPLSTASVRLFTALSPQQQVCIVLSMHAMWEASHPKSRQVPKRDLLATPDQRKAYVAFKRDVERSQREQVKFQAERTRRDRAIVRAMKGVAR
jgi:hypothetical protein